VFQNIEFLVWILAGRAMKRLVLGLSAEKFLLRFSFVLLLLPLIATQPDLARADDNSDAASTAVDLFVKAGEAAGLPINDTEVAIVKPLVACAVANNSNNGIGDCVKQAAIGVVLQQAGVTDQTTKDVVSGAVTCMTGKTDPAGCAAQIAASLLKFPPDAQPAVTCMLTGGNVADCGKKLAEGWVLDKVPAEIQAPAKCVIDGGNAQKCATDFVTQQVLNNLQGPMKDQAAAVVGCFGDKDVPTCVTKAVGNNVAPGMGDLVACAKQSGANLGQCAATFASANMPKLPTAPGGVDPNPAAKAVVACMGSSDIASCVEKAGFKNAANVAGPVIDATGQKAVQAALDTIQKLKPTADAATISSAPGAHNLATLRNILMVADGIKNNRYDEIVLGGGSEIAIIASQIILSVFLTPAVADLLGPAVQAMIHNDEAAAQQAFAAISKGDPVALAQVVFTWYATQFIDKPCALLGDTDVVNAVCGDMSKAIQQIATWGGDIAHAALDTIEDILKGLGVWGPIDSIATSVWNALKDALGFFEGLLGIGGHDDWKPPEYCAGMSPKGYFASNYLTCVSRASNAASPASLAGNTGALNSTCEQKFLGCVAPDKRGGMASQVASACTAMGKSLDDLANQISAAKGTAAYVSGLFKEAQKDGFGFGDRDFCDPNFWDPGTRQVYAISCRGFVNQQFPMAPASSCGLPNYSDGATAACLTSLQARLDANAAQGKPLTGPNSDYCKAQQQYVAEHDCGLKATGSQIVIVGGKEVTLPSKWECTKRVSVPFQTPGIISIPLNPNGDTLRPPPGGRGIDVGREVGILRGGGVATNPPVGSSGISTVNPNDPKIPAAFPAPVGGGHGPVVLPPLRPGLPLGAPPMKPPTTAGLPKGGGGSSGVSMVNGCSGNAPAAGCPPSKGGSGSGKGGGGSSGISMVNGNTNSPTTKSGTSKSGGSSGVSMINGNSGNSPTTKPSTSKSGGSSGVSMINGNSGNAPRLSPAFKDTPRMAPIITARPPVSSSGTNSAMDRLGGGSIGGVSGGGGGAARRPAFGAGAVGTSTNRVIPVPPRNDPNDLHVH
jgi:hypothetical protein